MDRHRRPVLEGSGEGLLGEIGSRLPVAAHHGDTGAEHDTTRREEEALEATAIVVVGEGAVEILAIGEGTTFGLAGDCAVEVVAVGIGRGAIVVFVVEHPDLRSRQAAHVR